MPKNHPAIINERVSQCHIPEPELRLPIVLVFIFKRGEQLKPPLEHLQQFQKRGFSLFIKRRSFVVSQQSVPDRGVLDHEMLDLHDHLKNLGRLFLAVV